MLNREAFKKSIPVLAARVAAVSVDTLRKRIDREAVLSIPRIKSVINDKEDPTKRILLLSEKMPQKELLPKGTQDILEEFGAELVDHTVNLTYDHFTTSEVLQEILPKDMEIPSAFEAVGHIAHMNLRDEHHPFRHAIGQVVLDKNRQIRTVVNKIGAIDSRFRFFQMEVIAGDADTIVEVHEEGCHFKFDYAKVYWNSRLQFEHRRLVQSFKPGSYVCDMFCGVGPFAIPAAKSNKCTVFANDLNPESISWLRQNIARNKVDALVKPYNMDARDFVPVALKDLLAQTDNKQRYFDHYIMNLPASAHEFLDTFLRTDVFSEDLVKNSMIHCYVFCRHEEDPLAKVSQVIGADVPSEGSFVRRVRDVAPNKEMFCVSFKLPLSLLDNRSDGVSANGEEPDSKKARVDC